MKLTITILLVMGCMAGASAQSIEEARSLMEAGNYPEAQSMLDYLIASSSKSNNSGTLNLLAGECALNQQENDAARNYFTKAAARGVADANLYLGRMAMTDYDFQEARDQYNKYISLRTKAGKDASEGEAALAGAALASDMLDRVEQITIIDAVTIPVEKLLSAIVISPQAGELFSTEDGEPGFISSDGRLRYTTATFSDDEGNEFSRIYEQTLLLSGDYDSPEPILDEEQAAYPFMMPDGCTFYFASEREGGLGGLDIYRSNRDSEDGSFMGAVNMGMPYNSPANDYLLAIDEHTGVGWFVTDRGHDGDGLATAYVFIPNEIRKNYDPDLPDIISRAMIEDIEATQEPGADYSATLAAIDALRNRDVRETARLTFTMPDGRAITSFPDRETIGWVKEYEQSREALDRQLADLASMRSSYATAPGADLAAKILQAEADTENAARELRMLLQRIIERIDR